MKSLKSLSCNLLLLLFTLNLSASDKYPRNFNIDILHYLFTLDINDSTNTIRGEATIAVRIVNSCSTISLDLKSVTQDGKGMNVVKVLCNGSDLKWEHSGERLVIFPAETFTKDDTVNLQINYYGIPADGLIISRNRFGDRTFFSDHWPDRAHNYLPCIDHPYDKAPVEFRIISPERCKVVSNGLLLSESAQDKHRKLSVWNEEKPLPVKVMAFGAAAFSVEESSNINGIPVTTWVFPQNRAEGFYDYSVAGKPLQYYTNLIGKYPFGKLANVQSKTIYGGLENASAIFYAERSVTGLGRAEKLIAHEIAHQWFGDCVTESDWHHVWLSEGFATYLTSMYFEYYKGSDELKADLDSTRKRIIAYTLDDPKPLIDENETNLMELLNVNSYQKGAWVLHMLRNELGDEQFSKGLKLFFEKNTYSNVLSSDFESAMEEVSGRNLDQFFRQWLYYTGNPVLEIRNYTKKNSSVLVIWQKQKDKFVFPIELMVQSENRNEVLKFDIKKRVTKIKIDRTISSVVPDPGVKLLFQYKMR
ncbi:MAG TPA: M1 family metallopeptidase [Bacteroidales bacterium]|nr:M1 family metallopeptidase [Bacteroidales bacterium]